MAVMFNKGTNYTILEQTFSISKVSLGKLKEAGIKFYMSDTSIALDNGLGYKKTHSFNTLINNIVKHPDPKHIVEVNAFVAEYINALNTVATASIPSEKPAVKLTKDFEKLPICKLRDAEFMYQKVYGTSNGSVYRLIAYNDKIKVAIRINGDALSVRVEGDITTDVITKFASVGISKKTDYMSGHYSCDNSTPQRAIGAILTGVDIDFDSPIPKLSKITE